MSVWGFPCVVWRGVWLWVCEAESMRSQREGWRVADRHKQGRQLEGS